ncbi:glycine zipper 2TM domain-containing protein [Pseudoduganella umbonata]|uniref:Glycine zipper 2TM domain-containing protein n=1 Tax=Pseudoduganella umbonata TaxID=864828 RepID=A0A4P8HWF2_9BURK|nr:glycine zipper 2TM domain-containing protein [Pseudoduganella umbonata]MBB3223368.1 outer membrane lipoprotein SlyB [Pseudoduganella umbonata]QCP13726.1 glycine zipper 2TM domain-containing protein [Pseudoduganella umbonata]
MKFRTALSTALTALTLSTLMSGAHADPHHKKRVCNECAKVTGVRVVEQDGKGGAAGVIVGGVAGGLLGNQIGSGTGRDLATVAGAVGGAYAGKHIEGKMKTEKTWKVSVRYENGRTGTFQFGHDPHMRKGDRVRREGGTLVRS